MERRLAAVSHADEAALIVARQIAFAQPNIIRVEPISYSGVLASGAINADEDRFTMLQGDFVTTETAYLMGERIAGSPLFAVSNSTCDLVPDRREYASLLRVFPVTGDGHALKTALHHLLSFRSRRDLYLPPLPNEDAPPLGYGIRFDGATRERLCSLSLVGWRILRSFARARISRAGDGEAALRSKLQRQSS